MKEEEQELDIRVFNTLGGRQIIGSLIDVCDECVYLSFAMECKTLVSNDGSYKTTFIPAIPFDDSNALVLHTKAIESEACASEKLEHIYINQLILNNLSVIASEYFDQNKQDQTNLTSLAKQDYWKNFKDNMMS